jgi:hypothetical protein
MNPLSSNIAPMAPILVCAGLLWLAAGQARIGASRLLKADPDGAREIVLALFLTIAAALFAVGARP